MKKYFYILLSLVALAGFTSCSDDELVGSHQMDNSISIIKQDVCFEATGGEGTITFEAPGNVTAKSSADWCKATVNGSTITVTADENTSYEARNAVVTITCGSSSRQVSVIQNGIQIWFTYTTQTIESAASGGTYKMQGKATDECTVKTNVDWINVQLDEEGVVTIKVDKNTNFQARTGKVTISAPAHKNEAVITIKQAEKKLPPVEGTYTMSFYTKADESTTGTVDVKIKKAETGENKYIIDLSELQEGWAIPVTMDTEKEQFIIDNGVLVGTYTSEGKTYNANLIMNYTNGSSNYVSYNTSDAKYGIYLSYEINESNKYKMTLFDSAASFSRTSTGMTIYAFSSTTLSSDTRVGSILVMRKPTLVMK